MAIQKKHGKGRLDKWYRLAKEKGYRARAAFKLIQLNKKYNFLEKSKVLIDLCAAPGSWCQVAAEVMPSGSLIVGVDLSPIKPVPRCITFQSDITTDKCRATLRQHLKTFKADTVLHDGAPNVGTAWVQDAFSQAELVLQSMKLATEFLCEGGTFVTKVFRSKDYNPLLWVFNQLFTKVEATKPPSSRNVSAEIFVVCRGYKAPKRIDPKFLDPRSVFAELSDPTPNNEAKVYNPEVKKRRREGYEEGDYIQFKEVPASEFIHTTDPIAMLGSHNKLSFDQKPNGDIALATLDKLPETTQEIRDCCADLKVLGRADFKRLLRWRLKVRDIFGFSKKQKDAQAAEQDEVAEVEPMDEELKMQEEIQQMKDRDNAVKKRERRRANEKRTKEITRMQMGMTTPFDIGLEQEGLQGADSVFALKTVDKAGGVNKIARGKMHTILDSDDDEHSKLEAEDEDEESDDEQDALERELDADYEAYQERRAMVDTKYRAKKARRTFKEDDEEFEGFSDRETGDTSDNDHIMRDEDSGSESDTDEDGEQHLITDLDVEAKAPNSLSKRAHMFFDQFEGIDGLDDEEMDSGIDVDEGDAESSHAISATQLPSRPKKKSELRSTIQVTKSELDQTIEARKSQTEDDDWSSDDDDSNGFETVKRNETEWEAGATPMKNGRPDIDIITAEAMTLAQQLATGKKSKYDMLDDGFNKYSLRDVDGLPEWFLDDENRHSKLQRPITAAAAAVIKEKMRALNARPIKKVREAKDRKKFKAAQRLEKLKQKSSMLIDDEGMTEKEKASSISKLMAKAKKKKPKQQVKVVVATGRNRANPGRPSGTKGKYKMVDARLKKDVRAEKRLAKKRK
ncbi:hypothetical protein EJ05DRAFT_531347 [Pseudovirgaria hyperparasitica]|uniref:Uncharacterized protein n=1 Tax=Pseudovirgaria hyperparasitica TaxID=470096 RepID=A0A6A6W9L7_9PEZI|nr:uncharacterized protein EJ05DRAFT_531347 [Pseudovirgaria hyperparasitica]KAF2758859.1 hypothetical protein EJ05DRAFT_531347 [Pseudovirgaria hyperparasitica]